MVNQLSVDLVWCSISCLWSWIYGPSVVCGAGLMVNQLCVELT